MGRLSNSQRRMARELFQKNYTTGYVEKLFREQGVSISRQALDKLKKKIDTTGDVCDLPRKAKARKFTEEHEEILKAAYDADDEVVSPKLQKQLNAQTG